MKPYEARKYLGLESGVVFFSGIKHNLNNVKLLVALLINVNVYHWGIFQFLTHTSEDKFWVKFVRKLIPDVEYVIFVSVGNDSSIRRNNGVWNFHGLPLFSEDCREEQSNLDNLSHVTCIDLVW